VLVAAFAFNEGGKIRATVERILAASPYDALVLDDGSTDGSIEALGDLPVQIVSNQCNEGIGSAMKRAFDYALSSGYEIIVIMAGSNKDDPTEIPSLLEPILEGRCDFVQGSRFLPGGDFVAMPLYRVLATRLHPFMFSLAVSKRLTETTNGFRALRLSILRDPRIRWRQRWLDQYELEPYLLYKAIALGYRHTEVAVTKTYPPKSLGYTKMRPLISWWSILRPVLYLVLGLRR